MSINKYGDINHFEANSTKANEQVAATMLADDNNRYNPYIRENVTDDSNQFVCQWVTEGNMGIDPTDIKYVDEMGNNIYSDLSNPFSYLNGGYDLGNDNAGIVMNTCKTINVDNTFENNIGDVQPVVMEMKEKVPNIQYVRYQRNEQDANQLNQTLNASEFQKDINFLLGNKNDNTFQILDSFNVQPEFNDQYINILNSGSEQQSMLSIIPNNQPHQQQQYIIFNEGSNMNDLSVYNPELISLYYTADSGTDGVLSSALNNNIEGITIFNKNDSKQLQINNQAHIQGLLMNKNITGNPQISSTWEANVLNDTDVSSFLNIQDATKENFIPISADNLAKKPGTIKKENERIKTFSKSQQQCLKGSQIDSLTGANASFFRANDPPLIVELHPLRTRRTASQRITEISKITTAEKSLAKSNSKWLEKNSVFVSTTKERSKVQFDICGRRRKQKFFKLKGQLGCTISNQNVGYRLNKKDFDRYAEENIPEINEIFSRKKKSISGSKHTLAKSIDMKLLSTPEKISSLGNDLDIASDDAESGNEEIALPEENNIFLKCQFCLKVLKGQREALTHKNNCKTLLTIRNKCDEKL